MRRKEERSEQGHTNNKAKQHSTPKAVTFPRKNELPQVGYIYTLYVFSTSLRSQWEATGWSLEQLQGVWSVHPPRHPPRIESSSEQQLEGIRRTVGLQM